MRDWTSLLGRVYEVSIGVIECGSESDDSPISLGLKLCEEALGRCEDGVG